MKSAGVAPVVAAVTITDQTCREACGFECSKSWKRAVVALKVPHAIIGRRWVVVAEDWIAAIRREAGATNAPTLTDAQVIELASRRGR